MSSIFGGYQSTKAADATYDFPRWEWVNPKPTGDDLSRVIACPDNQTVWAVGLGGTTIKSTDGGNTWTSIYNTAQSSLDMVCFDASNALAVGSLGLIMQYDGLSWSTRNSGTNYNLSKIISLGNNNLLVVGAHGTVLKSTNDGMTWSAKDSKTTDALSAIANYNTTIIAAGEQGSFIISHDYGETWTLNASSFPMTTDVLALSDTNYAVFNGPMSITSDGGDTWNTPDNSSGSDVAHIGNNTFVTANGMDGFGVSHDNGNTWSIKPCPGGIQYCSYMSTISGKENNVIATGNYGEVYVSHDYGDSWTDKTMDISAYISAYFLTSNYVIMVGENGKIYTSIDAGDNWVERDIGSITTIYGMTTIGSNTVVAVGLSGYISVSQDKGETWATKTDGTTNSFKTVTACGTNVVAAGDAAAYSHDSGDSWQTVGTIHTIKSITCFDADNFVAVGNSGSVFTSQDGGITWHAKTSNTIQTLTKVISFNSTYLIAVGSNGIIINSIDSGQNWTAQTKGTKTFNDVKNFDSNYVVAVGSSGTIYFTNDGGISWSSAGKSSTTTSTLTSIAVLDLSHGIIVGTGVGLVGTNYQTSNSGSYWSKNTDLNTKSLDSITALDATNAIAVGQSGAIYKTSNYGSSWSKEIVNASNTFKFVTSLDPLNIFMYSFNIGGSGILRYHSPANATATKLLVQLPGQSFSDGTTTGVFDNPAVESARAGEDVPVTIYATDSSNVLDKGNASTVGFTTTDPNDNNPAPIPLTKGDTCVQNRTDPSQSNCGQGTTNFVFHAPGVWTITASDTNNILAAGTSSDITVLPGTEQKTFIESSASSLNTGQATTSPIKLGLKDLYDNVTSPSADKSIHLSAKSSSRFSSSPNGPWSETLDMTIPAGGPTIDPSANQSASFYFLDYGPGTSAITASGAGLESGALNITINSLLNSANPLRSAGTRLEAKPVSLLAGGTSNLTVTLMMSPGAPAPGRVVKFYSSRSGDTVTNPVSSTGDDGTAVGSITSSTAGRSIISAFDETDGIWLEEQATITFNDPNTLQVLSPESEISPNVTIEKLSLIDQLRGSAFAKTIANILNPIVTTTAILGLIPLIAGIIGSAPVGLHALTYGISLSMEALGVRKRRKNWGRVYDSTTGKGVDLALVRLYTQQSMKLVGTIVTNLKGKYNFQPVPGTYVISVSKDGFVYPTQVFAKYGLASVNKRASKIDSHYLGQPITISEKDNFLNLDIPIDPIAKSPSFLFKSRIWVEDIIYLVTVSLSYIFTPALIIGAALSAFVAMVLPGARNMVTSIVYLIITLVYILSKMIKSHQNSTVIDTNNKPISGVMISIFDKEHDTLKESRITDRFGRFSIFADPGTYTLKADREHYEFEPEKIEHEISKNRAKNKFKGGLINLKKPDFIRFTIVGRKK